LAVRCIAVQRPDQRRARLSGRSSADRARLNHIAKNGADKRSERAQERNHAGYARYDERTATMLGSTAEMLLREYKGDLRLLRE
jgi:hypothetical protein